jgi:hypothetical protein
MNAADEIIDSHGGNEALAKRFGISSAAVSNWRKRGELPRERIASLLADPSGMAAPKQAPGLTDYQRGVADTISRLVRAGVVQMPVLLAALVEGDN